MLSGADDNQYPQSTASMLDERELEAMLSSKTTMQQNLNCSKIHAVLLTFGLFLVTVPACSRSYSAKTTPGD